MLRRVLNWLEERTGIETLVKHFLYENVPASSGWRHVFGSVAMFLFLVQAFTGLLLAFNYAPTPGDAYNSVRYIVTEVTGGRILRGLHHWGASMMIVVVVLHMTQVFLWGCYKKPREATWIVGCVLLMLTLAYGLTGYLLPWDNRAYWGTVVTTQIAGLAPGLGPYVQRLLGADGATIGVVTFTRFFAVHTMLLPPITVLLIMVHIYLVRKHGVAPEPGETEKTKFYPAQVYRDTVAMFAAFAVLWLLAVAARVPLGRLADPTDTTYIPRPEWYFMFLFQTLKFFEGPLELVGAVILPNLAIVALFLVPFIDRGTAARVRQRTLAIGIAAFAAIGWTGLTAAAIASTPRQADQEIAEGPQTWQELTPEELAGVGYFRTENCAQCHPPGKQGRGPDLTTVAIRKDAAWMIAHFKNPSQVVPGSQMPPIQLADSQLNALAAFLLKLTPKNIEVLSEAPDFAVEGAMIYQQNKCGMCHQINGVGQKLGPPLNGVAERRQRDWVEQHFLDPQKLSPGTTMPAYRFNARDLDKITTFLMQLPRQP